MRREANLLWGTRNELADPMVPAPADWHGWPCLATRGGGPGACVLPPGPPARLIPRPTCGGRSARTREGCPRDAQSLLTACLHLATVRPREVEPVLRVSVCVSAYRQQWSRCSWPSLGRPYQQSWRPTSRLCAACERSNPHDYIIGCRKLRSAPTEGAAVCTPERRLAVSMQRDQAVGHWPCARPSDPVILERRNDSASPNTYVPTCAAARCWLQCSVFERR